MNYALLGLALLTLWFSSSSKLFQQLLHNKHQQHLLFAGAVCLAILSFIRAGIYPGLDLHFLGITAIILTLGLRLGLWCAFISTLPLLFVGVILPAQFASELVIGLMLPALFSYVIFMWVYHHLPKHFFVYIFCASFIAAALTFILRALLMAGYFYVEENYSWDILQANYLKMLPLFLVPEAMLNGMAMTILVIYRPQWVATFDDKIYLNKNNDKK